MATSNGKTVGASNILLRVHPWFDTDGWNTEFVTTAIADGQIVKKTTGTWAAITALPVSGDVLGIVIDATKENSGVKRIIKGGDYIVKASGLLYFSGATTGNKTATNALLEALGMQVNDNASALNAT